MKNKTNTCNSKDYDFYTIMFPFKAILRQKKEKLIYAELEKLHPCFCDDCCFDSKLRLQKGWVKAEVIVMQKLKLAEYKGAGKRIYIPEVRGKQFFVNKKIGKVMFFCIVLLILLTGLFTLVTRDFQKPVDQKTNYQTVVEEALEVVNGINVCDLLASLNHPDSAVDRFLFEEDGFSLNCTLVVKGVFPEAIESICDSAVLSSVSFSSKMPVLTIQLNQKHPGSTSFVSEKISGEFKSSFRQQLQQIKAELLEEFVNPYGVHFCLDFKSEQEGITAFKNFVTSLKASGLSLKYFELNRFNQKLDFNIYFFEARVQNQEQLFDALIENAALFFRNQGAQKEIQPLQKAYDKKNEVEPDSSFIHLGKIVGNDGMITDFYKDSKGKIIQKRR